MVLSREWCDLIKILKMSLRPFYEEWIDGREGWEEISELAFSTMLSALNKNELRLFHEASIKELKRVWGGLREPPRLLKYSGTSNSGKPVPALGPTGQSKQYHRCTMWCVPPGESCRCETGNLQQRQSKRGAQLCHTVRRELEKDAKYRGFFPLPPSGFLMVCCWSITIRRPRQGMPGELRHRDEHSHLPFHHPHPATHP